MTLYLTDHTTREEITRAKASGFVHGVKLYPAGATTHSEAGVTDVARLDAVLARMAELDLVLQVHGEVTDPAVDVFEREARFIDAVLQPLAERHPRLRIVFEHITTEAALQFVLGARAGVAATVTPQHLLMNRNALFAGGIRPHHYCLPVLKSEPHRAALLEAVAGGTPRLFLGTDSAPHAAQHQGGGLRLRRHLLRARRHRAVRRGLRGRRRTREARGLRRLSRRGLLPPAAQPRHPDPQPRAVAGAGPLPVRRRRAGAAARRRAHPLARRAVRVSTGDPGACGPVPTASVSDAQKLHHPFVRGGAALSRFVDGLHPGSAAR